MTMDELIATLDYLKGSGPTLRTATEGRFMLIKRGVTNKMLEVIATDILKSGEYSGIVTLTGVEDNEIVFTGDFLLIFSKKVIAMSYANEVNSKVESVVSKKEEKVMDDVKVVNYQKTPNQPKIKVESRVDYSILFLRSSQWAFLICLLGVFGEAFHIYHVFFNLSDIVGWGKWSSSLLWATVFSFSLMFVVLKAGSLRERLDNLLENKVEGKSTIVLEQKLEIDIEKNNSWIGFFTFTSLIFNIYFYWNKFVLIPAILSMYIKDDSIDWDNVVWNTFNWAKVQWPAALMGTIIACFIPFTIKSWAGSIRLPHWLDKVFLNYDRKEN